MFLIIKGLEALPWVHLKTGEHLRVVSGQVTKTLCHHRRYEEISENEVAEEGEEDVFAVKASPHRDECPALKVGRAREAGTAVLGNEPSALESRHSKNTPTALGDRPLGRGGLWKIAEECPCLYFGSSLTVSQGRLALP